jgi:hypothetical protein
LLKPEALLTSDKTFCMVHSHLTSAVPTAESLAVAANVKADARAAFVALLIISL